MRFLRTCLATTALIPVVFAPAWANPLGGNVVQGGATIGGVGTAEVTVTQQTDRAAINWQSFDIEKGERTRFVQPSQDSVILNRVTGGQNASRIYGTLQSNGTVYLVNPDGVLFGPSAVVNTGSLLATTHDITDTDFMAGRDRFSLTTDAQASVVNEGLISVRDGGFAALVAPGVRNDGIITATYGSVGMSAVGSHFSLDLRGDQLINFAVSDEIANDVKDVKTGKSLSTLIENKGTLKANGGRVALTAATARKVVDSVINNTGVIEANSVGTQNGRIILGAATATTKESNAPAQIVRVAGKLSASGKRSGEKGGKIQVTGEAVAIESASIDAGGDTGGGTVLLGGDYHGGKPVSNQLIPFEATPVPNADYLYVDGASTISASAYTSGNGGKVILWGNEANFFKGNVVNTGGGSSGIGGVVEVSSPNNLMFNGHVDTSSASGMGGLLLLDPRTLTIGTSDEHVSNFFSGETFVTPNFSNGNTTSTISAATIENLMLTNYQVDILMSDSGGEGRVDINSNITAPANNSNLWIIQGSNYLMDVNLNSVIDFSASTGQFRIGSTSAAARSITASAGAKIIGNTGYISLDALKVGDLAAPIPVEVVPDSDATTQNYVYCANYGVCSDSGTRISVIDAYATDADAFRNNVFVAVSLRSGQTTSPSTTPTTPNNPPSNGNNNPGHPTQSQNTEPPGEKFTDEPSNNKELLSADGILIGNKYFSRNDIKNIANNLGISDADIADYISKNKIIPYYGKNDLIESINNIFSDMAKSVSKADPRLARIFEGLPEVGAAINSNLKAAKETAEVLGALNASEAQFLQVSLAIQERPVRLLAATSVKLLLATGEIYAVPFQLYGLAITASGDVTGIKFLQQWGDKVGELHALYENGRAELNKKIDKVAYQ